MDIIGAEGTLPAILTAAFYRTHGRPAVVVLPTERDAAVMAADLAAFGVNAHLFPWWGAVPYHLLAPSSPVFAARARLLAGLAAPSAALQPPLVLTSQRAFISPLPPPDSVRKNLFTLRPGGAIDTAALAKLLAGWGWSRVGRVQLTGEFALRGEVLDVLPPGGGNCAYRVLFDYDAVETIKEFDPDDQAGTQSAPHLNLYPLKEVVWTDDRIETLDKNLRSCGGYAPSTIDGIVETLIAKKYISGEEELYPLAFDVRSSLIDYFYPHSGEGASKVGPIGGGGGEPLVFFVDRERLDNAQEALEREAASLYQSAVKERPAPPPERIFFSWPQAAQACKQTASFRKIRTGADGVQPEGAETAGAETAGVVLSSEPPHSFFGNIDFLKEEITRLYDDGWRIVLAAESDAQCERIASILHADFLPSNQPQSEPPYSGIRRGAFSVDTLPLSQGFFLTDIQFAVITENEIFGRKYKKPRSLAAVRSVAIDTFVELNPGDYIVHINYGIGIFQGIDRITALGSERDYIKLLYADEEVVFVPIEQVNLVQRYIGSDGGAVKLDTLGSKSWSARKEKAKRAAEELAQKLIGLYAKRKASRGFAFPPDTEWQAMFEANFAYEETADQIRCVEEIKADMESVQPMDRLVCGDVGYGKTEVAIRACFKAVMAGKQAAFLAPTTILTEQHYETFKERFARFPVNIALLSRFVDRKTTRNVVAKTKNGEVDILIGTHRIIQKDIAFKDLGLLVIDEEQRFGVKDKERLKEMKHNVDCLSLSATPIPRTLHISLLKIRDMSILATAPRNRRPIQTIIEEINDEKIAAAVRAEAARGGQVFYLHNRIESLDATCTKLRRLLPEMLFESAHGRMDSDDLEDVMRRFIHGGFHVLVSTTIIENGIDIPNVNTIIIDRADMYGVSQLYQLKGRVGRSDRVAYAYLFYPENRSLSETAMKRLQVISDFTELGSGFKIAMKDMEIRGAGNLLGREQSGNIYSVGFDMYLRLLDEAIQKLQNEHYEQETETLLELEYSGYIPDSYISTAQEKMEVYKKIAAVKTPPELDALQAEILDRFGPPPQEAAALLALAEIRVICRRLAVSRLKEKDGKARITFSNVHAVRVDALLDLIKSSGGTARLDPASPSDLILHTGKIGLPEKAFFIREKLEALAP
ncbi:MAG: transcription-repair coupling factor [Spirochaetaceae bacterium]|nr:transcription-repair coupling factor [Spirochaetaceae bacterium]